MDKLSKAQIEWLKSGPYIGPMLTLSSPDGRVVSEYEVLDRSEDGRVHALARRHGFKGFVLRVREPTTGTTYAAKLAVPGDYVDGRLENELSYAQRLRRGGNLFVCPTAAGRCQAPAGMPGAKSEFVCFLTPWVDGDTLESLLRTKEIDGPFACYVALDVLRAVLFLERVGLKHDDLHTGNVMISEVAPELAIVERDRNRLEVSIIDLGSLKPAMQVTQKSRDDRLSLLQILAELFNGLHRNRRFASSHPKFMRGFRQFIEKLSDDDIGRHFPADEDIAIELDTLRRHLDTSDVHDAQTKFAPFEAISAEHLADDALLLNLFVSTLPWMQDLQEKKPIVLTGPRGCGKSMIFRYLAVRTHLGRPNSALRSDQDRPFDSFGVYVSCATHLQNNLSWLGRREGRPAQRSHEISTYFQLVVVRELLRALGQAHADAEANRHFRFDESGFDRLIEFVSKYFKSQIESPRLRDGRRLLHFADDIDSMRVRLHGALIREMPWDDSLPDTFISDITAKLREFLPYFTSRPVVFLLDDYSANRVQKDIQAILTKIVFERVPSHVFKISCEKFGFSEDDIDDVRIDETREFTTIDAGRSALTDGDDAAARTFVQKLIDQRLETAQWKGRAMTLLGQSEPFDDDVALTKSLRKSGGSRTAHYYGLHALGRLWSGDTATILQIVRDMFVRGKVGPETTTSISKMTQHDAIVSISKAFRGRVDGYHPHGGLMANVLGQFANAVREVLVKGAMNDSDVPYRLYRLEMTKDEARPTIRLLQDADAGHASLACELLRRAIFIELDDSRGKEGPAKQTMRWELRRIFNPAFGLSLQRDSYLNVRGLRELQLLLSDPSRFSERVRMSYAINKRADQHTPDIFGADHEE